MPTNVTYEYVEAEKEYLGAKTNEQKIVALERMLATVPKHKGTEKLRNQLRQRLAKLRKNVMLAKKASKGKSQAIRKAGAATVVFVGAVDSGKSKLFARLSGAEYKGGNNYEMKMRMIPYENIWLQGIDLPAIHAKFSSSVNTGQILNTIRTADMVVLVADRKEELEFLEKELKSANILFGAQKKQDFGTTVIPMVATHADTNVAKLKETIWQKTGKIKAQTRTKAGVAEKPIVLKAGSTVKDLAETIHKDFLKKFKYAKVWGHSALFPGQVCGLDHKLKDNDIVEIFVK